MALAQSGIKASVWTSIGPQRSVCEVNPFFDAAKPQSIEKLPALLAKEPIDWLVVEYNPFGYGRWGYCPWLIKTVRQLKRSGRCRVAVIFFTRPRFLIARSSNGLCANGRTVSSTV